MGMERKIFRYILHDRQATSEKGKASDRNRSIAALSTEKSVTARTYSPMALPGTLRYS